MPNQLTNPEPNVTPILWSAPDNLPLDDWLKVGFTLQQIERSLPWWIGDWLNYGEKQYGETYAQGIEATGMRIQRLKNYKWVAGAVDESIRIESLSWTCHRYVAHLPHADQVQWLMLAVKEGWASDQLLRQLQGEKETASDAVSRLLASAGVPGGCTLIERIDWLVTAYLELKAKV